MLTAGDIATLTTELGGLTQTLREATPPEKAGIHQGPGLHLPYQADRQVLVATADLGRVLVVSEGDRMGPQRPERVDRVARRRGQLAGDHAPLPWFDDDDDHRCPDTTTI